jgi:hypothetical protein
MQTPHIDEVWKPVPVEGFDDAYEVSNLGRVRRSKAFVRNNAIIPGGNILKLETIWTGYKYASMNNNGKRKSVAVHRLVAMAFISPPPHEKSQVCHNDGSRDNNAVSNLRWGDAQENANDRVRHGTTLKGSDNPGAVMNDDLVLLAHTMHTVHHWPIIRIARAINVNPGTIRYALAGNTWPHVLSKQPKQA